MKLSFEFFTRKKNAWSDLISPTVIEKNTLCVLNVNKRKLMKLRKMLVGLRRVPAVVCSVSEVGERTGERVLSPAPPAVVGGLVTSPSNVELWAPAASESMSVAAKKKRFFTKKFSF